MFLFNTIIYFEDGTSMSKKQTVLSLIEKLNYEGLSFSNIRLEEENILLTTETGNAQSLGLFLVDVLAFQGVYKQETRLAD